MLPRQTKRTLAGRLVDSGAIVCVYVGVLKNEKQLTGTRQYIVIGSTALRCIRPNQTMLHGVYFRFLYIIDRKYGSVDKYQKGE